MTTVSSLTLYRKRGGEREREREREREGERGRGREREREGERERERQRERERERERERGGGREREGVITCIKLQSELLHHTNSLLVKVAGVAHQLLVTKKEEKERERERERSQLMIIKDLTHSSH